MRLQIPAYFLTLSLILIMSLSLAAQNESNSLQAQKIDEFYPNDVISPVVARLDNYAVQIQNDPNSTAYVVTYRYYTELPGRNARTLNWVKKYLTEDNRRTDPNRIVLVDGGISRCPVTELWIAPAGTTPKINEEYRQFFVDTDYPRKFDEHYFTDEKFYADIENGYGRGMVNSLDALAAAVAKEPKALAYLIIYREVGEPASVATRLERLIRSELVGKYKLPPARVKIVNGGFRRMRQVESWIVPRAARPPVATPNAFPQAKTKRRK